MCKIYSLKRFDTCTHICEIIPKIKMMNIFIHSRFPHALLSSSSSSLSCSLDFKKSLLCFIMLYISLNLLKCCENGIVCIFSSLFYQLALFWGSSTLLDVLIAYRFSLLNSILLYEYIMVGVTIHLLIGIWVVSNFWLLQIKQLVAFIW